MDEAEKVDTSLNLLCHPPFIDLIILMSASEPLFAWKRTLLEFRVFFEADIRDFLKKSIT